MPGEDFEIPLYFRGGGGGGGKLQFWRNSKNTHATQLSLVSHDSEDMISYLAVIAFRCSISISTRKQLSIMKEK